MLKLSYLQIHHGREGVIGLGVTGEPDFVPRTSYYG
jgi:hypothetical protein